MNYNKIVQHLMTSRDATKMSDNELAGVLTLSFIGMIARPYNVNVSMLHSCVKAFNNNRGKTEVEELAGNLEKELTTLFPDKKVSISGQVRRACQIIDKLEFLVCNQPDFYKLKISFHTGRLFQTIEHNIQIFLVFF